MDTKHAWTMKSENGLEILVHLGLDTVKLKGEPFSLDIQAGDQVIAGQQVGTMDLQKIAAANKAATVITVITNLDQVAVLDLTQTKTIAGGAIAANIKLK
jgi:PTS system sucrose-specific IIC component